MSIYKMFDDIEDIKYRKEAIEEFESVIFPGMSRNSMISIRNAILDRYLKKSKVNFFCRLKAMASSFFGV